MDAAILDSDILSELLKRRDAVVLSNASAYLGVHSRFAFSAFVRVEVRRGLLEITRLFNSLDSMFFAPTRSSFRSPTSSWIEPVYYGSMPDEAAFRAGMPI